MTEEIKRVILATDLANYFRARTRLLQICAEEEFKWDNEQHRHLLKSIMITSADLSGQCKPYHVAKTITVNLYSK